MASAEDDKASRAIDQLGAYSFGKHGSESCPAYFTTIRSEKECDAARKILSIQEYNGDVMQHDHGRLPHCYIAGGGRANFNPNGDSGNRTGTSMLICRKATTHVCATMEHEECACTGKVYFGKKYKELKPDSSPRERTSESGETTDFEYVKQSSHMVMMSNGAINCSSVQFMKDPLPGLQKWCYCEPQTDDMVSMKELWDSLSDHPSGTALDVLGATGSKVSGGSVDLEAEQESKPLTLALRDPSLVKGRYAENCESCDCTFLGSDGLVTNCDIEINSRAMVNKYVPDNATVLEVGARFGTVSCEIAKKLQQSGRQVSIDADPIVWDALEKNRVKHGCNFNSVHGLLAKQDGLLMEDHFGTFAASKDAFESSYASGRENKFITVPHQTLDDIQRQHSLKFDTANMDCEGCAPFIFKDFPELKHQLKLLILESHNDEEAHLVEDLKSNGWVLAENRSRQFVLYNTRYNKTTEAVHFNFKAGSTYMLGDAGSDVCPTSYEPVKSHKECNTARQAMGKDYNGMDFKSSDFRLPYCWLGGAGKANFNPDGDSGTGEDKRLSKLICKSQAANPHVCAENEGDTCSCDGTVYYGKKI
jgi:FkbM family methyltransferase